MTTQKNKRTGKRANKVLARKSAIAPASSNKVTRRTPIVPTSVTAAMSVVTIVFDQDVVLKGIPQYPDEAMPPKLPTAAAKTGLGTVQLTYASAPTTGIVIPFEDPAIRNAAGGYVQPGTNPLS